MSAIKCQAKNPATCRYHKPTASIEALKKVNELRKEYRVEMSRLVVSEHLDGLGEFNQEHLFDLKTRLQEAEEVYDATPEGIAALSDAITRTEDPNVKERLEYRKNVATWRLEEAERKAAFDAKHGGPLIPEGTPTYTPAGVQHGGNHLWPETVGNKYSPEMTLTQVKSNINKDIKEAQKGNYLPKNVDFDIRARSGSLRVTIYAPPALVREEVNSNGYQGTLPDAMELKDRVENIVAAYNRTQYDEIEGRRNTGKFWENVSFADSWDFELRDKRKQAKTLKTK